MDAAQTSFIAGKEGKDAAARPRLLHNLQHGALHREVEMRQRPLLGAAGRANSRGSQSSRFMHRSSTGTS